jgi:hypothetical protein
MTGTCARKARIILAENGGLEVALEPDGVFGIWKAGAWRLKRELLLFPLW